MDQETPLEILADACDTIHRQIIILDQCLEKLASLLSFATDIEHDNLTED